MLVGKSSIDIIALEKHAHNAEELIAFADSLVPEEFRHNKSICDNQRYLCCVNLRKSTKLSWDMKKAVINEILNKVRITGYVDRLIEVEELYMYTDAQKVMEYLGGLK